MTALADLEITSMIALAVLGRPFIRFHPCRILYFLYRDRGLRFVSAVSVTPGYMMPQDTATTQTSRALLDDTTDTLSTHSRAIQMRLREVSKELREFVESTPRYDALTELKRLWGVDMSTDLDFEERTIAEHLFMDDIPVDLSDKHTVYLWIADLPQVCQGAFKQIEACCTLGQNTHGEIWTDIHWLLGSSGAFGE